MEEYKIRKYIGALISSMHQTFLKKRLLELSDVNFCIWFKEYFEAFDLLELKEMIEWAINNSEYSFEEIPPGTTRFSHDEILQYIRAINEKLRGCN